MRTQSSSIVGLLVVAVWYTGLGYCQDDASGGVLDPKQIDAIKEVCRRLNAPNECSQPIDHLSRPSTLFGTVSVIETSDVVVEFEGTSGALVGLTNKRCRPRVISTHEATNGEIRPIAKCASGQAAFKVNKEAASAIASEMFELVIPDAERPLFVRSDDMKESGSLHWYGFLWSREIGLNNIKVGFDEITVRVEPYEGCVIDVDRLMQVNKLEGATPVEDATETALQEIRGHSGMEAGACEISSRELRTVHLGGEARRLWIFRLVASDGGESCPLAGVAVSASTGLRDQEVEQRLHWSP